MNILIPTVFEGHTVLSPSDTNISEGDVYASVCETKS